MEREKETAFLIESSGQYLGSLKELGVFGSRSEYQMVFGIEEGVFGIWNGVSWIEETVLGIEEGLFLGSI